MRHGTGMRRADGSMSGLSSPGAVSAERIPDSVIRVFRQMDRGGPESQHPAVFPVNLALELASAYSSGNDLILDQFMGSGTTLVAAKQLGRRAIGIEIEEKYCQIAVERLRQAVLPLEPAAPEPKQLNLETEHAE